MATREGEERGGGIPYTEEERLQRHEMLYPGAPLPERGYGLTASEIVGRTPDDLRIALDAMENTLKVGGKARVALYSERLATEEDLAELYLQLTAQGHHCSYPTATLTDGVPTLQLDLTKGSPALPIAVIPMISLFIILGVVVFGILRLEQITKALLPIVIAGTVGLIVIAFIMRKPAERAIERAGEKYLPQTYPKAQAARSR